MRTIPLLLVVSLVSLTAVSPVSRAADWELPATDSVVLEVGGAGVVERGWGDWGDTATLGNGGLAFTIGVAVCLGDAPATRYSEGRYGVGVVGDARGIYDTRGYGSIEAGLSVCKRFGLEQANHTYVSGSAAGLRYGNVETQSYGGHLGQIVVVASPDGNEQGKFDASAFVGVMQNVFFVPGHEESDQPKLFAVGARVRGMYRDLLHRIELEGSAQYTQGVDDLRNLSVDASAALRFLAVRLGTGNQFLYVGVQGNVLHARSVITTLDNFLGHADEVKSQTGVSGMGTLGVSLF